MPSGDMSPLPLYQMESFHDLSWHTMILNDTILSLRGTICHQISWYVMKCRHVKLKDFSFSLRIAFFQLKIFPQYIWWHLMTFHNTCLSDSERSKANVYIVSLGWRHVIGPICVCLCWLALYPGPVGSIIYADLYGSIKIKFTVLIPDTDQ